MVLSLLQQCGQLNYHTTGLSIVITTHHCGLVLPQCGRVNLKTAVLLIVLTTHRYDISGAVLWTGKLPHFWTNYCANYTQLWCQWCCLALLQCGLVNVHTTGLFIVLTITTVVFSGAVLFYLSVDR